MPKETADKLKFSEIANSQERKILLWFFSSLALGFAFPFAWVVTLFLGLSVIPLLIPKVLAAFCVFLADHNPSKILSRLFLSAGRLFIVLIFLVIIAMIFGMLANPGRF